MVNVKFVTSVALLGFRLVAALPTAADAGINARDDAAAPFSFESWAIDLANGKTQVTPEEALRLANTTGVEPLRKRDLEKRLRCNHLSIPPAYVPDAVSCINYLARSGLMCRVESVVAMCTIGRAQIVGVKGGTNAPYTESSCNDVARAAGYVMDNCWRADNTVLGDHYAYGNGNMAVHIASPSI